MRPWRSGTMAMAGFGSGMRGPWLVMGVLFGSMAGGCAERSPAGPPAALAPQLSPDLFAAAVRWLDDRTQAPVIVDPRPLRPEAALDSVAESDLLAGETETVRMRTRVVESGGWGIADAPRDWRCVWSQVLPPPVPRPEPDSLRLRYAACRARAPYESLVFGLPQAGTDPNHPHRWRMRTLRMLANGYEVVDLFLERRPGGDWAVAEARVRSGVFS